MKKERKKILYAITYFIVQEKDYDKLSVSDDNLGSAEPSENDEIHATLLCLPEIKGYADVRFVEKLIAAKRFLDGTDDFLEQVAIVSFEPKTEVLDPSKYGFGSIWPE